MNRDQLLERLERERSWDFVVIGGGATARHMGLGDHQAAHHQQHPQVGDQLQKAQALEQAVQAAPGGAGADAPQRASSGQGPVVRHSLLSMVGSSVLRNRADAL